MSYDTDLEVAILDYIFACIGVELSAHENKANFTEKVHAVTLGGGEYTGGINIKPARHNYHDLLTHHIFSSLYDMICFVSFSDQKEDLVKPASDKVEFPHAEK